MRENRIDDAFWRWDRRREAGGYVATGAASRTARAAPPAARRPAAAAVLAALALVTALGSAAPVEADQAPDPVVLADSLAATIHEADMRGDLAALAGARTLARRAVTAYPQHPLLTYYLAETFYREATHRLESEPDSAQALLERAQDILDPAAERENAIPETHALRGSVIGMRITNMLKGITMGPGADAAIERALEAGPENPRVWLARGIGTLNKPGFVGGGVEPALEQFERARVLFERDDPAPGHPAWGEAELRAWIGIAHAQEGRTEEARRAFEAALRIEPEFEWVRYVLLPGLEGG